MRNLPWVAGLCAIAGVTIYDLVRDGTPLGMDTATAFYPWYAYLGESLRSGHIPMWNPFQFAGTPFAADPESGWAYLPAMLFFTLLPLPQAAAAYMLFHVLLAALATYALSRSLGIHPVGAFASGFAYSYSGFFLGHNVCCFAYADVAAWLPLGLLGLERAIQARGTPSRARWWAVTGLAISQILAAWIGQGAYYALVLLCAYAAYRSISRSRGGIRTLLMHEVAPVGIGFGLAAVGLLPRLEYNLVSNLPGGYGAAGLQSPTAGLMDWGIIEDWQTRLLQPGFHYAGLSVLLMAVCAPFIIRACYAVPFFTVTSVLVLVLARWQPTPLHVALSVLPGFGPMHEHAPERALLIWFIGPALLSGALLSRLMTVRHWGRALAGVLLLLAVFDLSLSWRIQLEDAQVATGAYEIHHLDPDAYYAPTAAERFLQGVTAARPARVVGYAQHVSGGPLPYTLRWASPRVVALGVNNRAMLAGLYDVQGYDPIHLARFDAYMSALNAQPQNYHQSDVFESGLDSRLLDLLGVRYIVVAAQPASDESESHITRALQTVYLDDQVRVLENELALPRAWLVHGAVRMDAEHALAGLASGEIDPRRTVVLDGTPAEQSTESTGSAADESVTWDGNPVELPGDDVRLHVHAGAPAWLVLSDTYYPAWHARVDGVPTPIELADGALRAVAVPPGDHSVQFVYDSPALAIGAAISGLTVAVVAVLALRKCTAA
ncbi:MAG: hypothetical protein JOZ81_31985 [Chloroflexi bacterium]|nr:hypothetical protein [Chloroflexota bacterium]